MFCKGTQILIMEVCLQMDKWFTIDQIDEGTYIISEYRHWEETHCYLLNGSSRSLLIDTGLGICNIYDEVMKLTNKPVTAGLKPQSGLEILQKTPQKCQLKC